MKKLTDMWQNFKHFFHWKPYVTDDDFVHCGVKGCNKLEPRCWESRMLRDMRLGKWHEGEEWHG